MGLVIVLFSVGIVCGVILALHFMGKRPININIDARAEAHGGSSYAGVDDGRGGGIIGGMGGLIKFVALAAIAVLALVTIGNLLAQRSAAERPIVINVPTQIPQPVPNVIVTVPAPVVNVPKAEPPVINVQPQAPIVNVPVSTSPLETIGLIIGAIASVIGIIVSIKMLRLIRTQGQPTTQHPYPVEYERTPYGWTPKPQEPQEPIKADDVAPGLFGQKVGKS